MINRSAVLVRPRRPYLAWADSHGDGVKYPRTGERSVYLLPEFEMPAEADAILRHFYDIIFEEELSGWINDPATWPQHRTYKLFLEWFSVEHDSVIEDLVAGDAIVDDAEP